ncbi:MAG: phytanoyl-CoA dioxygenase family protein [Candidatus Kapaibacterium sp.]
MTDDALNQYFSDGFQIVHDLYTEAELQPAINAIDEKVDELAKRLYESGKIEDRFDNDGFLTRLTKLEQAFPGAATLIHTGGILPQAFIDLWSSDKLLDIIEQILGPEIAGHPVWNLRSKTPNNPLATVPWHQDTAYLAAGSEHTFQPTAWIPLVDANAVNGCMQVVRGGHSPVRVIKHKLENTRGNKDSWYLYIDEADLPEGEIVTCEMRKGSVLLLNNTIPHRSTENFSNIIRWSIDLRWQRPGEPSGMESIKESILMRTANDPNYQPDWKEWAARSRQVGLQDVLAERDRPISEADAKVTGPWMARWNIVNARR